MTSRKKLTLGILSIGLICALAIGGTLAFLTDSEKVTNTFSIADLDITIDEPSWDPGDPDDPTKPGDGEDLTPGDTKVKDPTVTAVTGDSYMRVVMTIVDNDEKIIDTRETIPNPDYDATTNPGVDQTIANPTYNTPIDNPNYGKVITDEARLNLILQTIRYDSTYDATNHTTTGIVEGTSYSLANLTSYKTVNEANFTLDTTRSTTAGTYYYNYTNSTTKDVFKENSSAVLFTNIVIPTDWNRTQLDVLGKYKVVVYAQSIQTANFADAATAFTALDTEITNKTLQYNYKVVGTNSDK